MFDSQKAIAAIIQLALEEDLNGRGDITSKACVPKSAQSQAVLMAKEKGVIYGLEIFRQVFHKVDRTVRFKSFVKDGAIVKPRQTLLTLKGSSRSLLAAERTALNFVQNLSGIATLVHSVTRLLVNSKTQILDTRKTLPGMRVLQKQAVKAGGGSNHRMGLYDMVLIKENHITAAGGIASAIQRCRKKYPKTAGVKIEIEVKNKAEFIEAQKEKPDIIMLDNMTPRQVSEILKIRGGGVKIELSGNMSPEKIRRLKKFDIDYISMGALTHSARAFDVSLVFSE